MNARFDRRLVRVQFPGLVNDESAAIECLGGAEEMAQAHSAESRLQLRFRKDDPYCKPASSSTVSCYGILLKIKVKKNDRADPPRILSTEVVGVVDTAYKFETLADYQYLPIKDDTNDSPHSNMDKNMLNVLRPDGIVGEEWLNSAQDLFLVPSLFSRIDCPQNYLYRANIKKQDLETPENLIGGLRKGRSSCSVFISFNHTDETPTNPSKKAKEILSLVNESDIEIVKELYCKRPIWSKTSLLYESKLPYSILKKILLNIAYYYVNGPWHHLWVKLGYDPRKEPQSRIYQSIDFRFRNADSFKNLLKKNEKNKLSATKSQKNDDVNIDILEKNKTENSAENEYMFRPGMVPPKKQVFYQYCDLKVPEVEEMLSKLGEVLPGSLCDDRKGWMPNGFDEQCRDIINGYIIDKMREVMAENLVSIQRDETNDESNYTGSQLDEGSDYDDYDDEEDDEDNDADSEYDVDLDKNNQD